MAQIAWLGKKSPFCGNVSYGLSTTEALRRRGHQTHFIHFDNPRNPESGGTSLLANDPDVILADEPTGNLDTHSAATVFDIFAELARKRGKAVIAVTHDPDLAARTDRRIHIVDGRIVEGGA